MSNNFFCVALLALFIQPSLAKENTFEFCKKAADNVTKMGITQKDKYTFVRGAGCIPGNPKNRFVYMLELRGISTDIIRHIDVARDIKPDGLRQFCTDPAMRALLNAYDVDHRYYLENGVYVGSFLMQSRECSK
jgi:hypothetical protein